MGNWVSARSYDMKVSFDTWNKTVLNEGRDAAKGVDFEIDTNLS